MYEVFLLDETGVGKADKLVVTKTYEHAIWGAGGSLRLNGGTQGRGPLIAPGIGTQSLLCRLALFSPCSSRNLVSG